MNDKIYLVTGATGFLGSNICRELVEQGRRVRAFVLSNDKGTAHIPKEVEVVEGNLCDKKSLKNLFDVPANMEIVVIHAASIVTVEPEYNQKVMDARGNRVCGKIGLKNRILNDITKTVCVQNLIATHQKYLFRSLFSKNSTSFDLSSFLSKPQEGFPEASLQSFGVPVCSERSQISVFSCIFGRRMLYLFHTQQ